MKAPIDGGGTITQRFGLPASSVVSLEPAMYHDGNRRAYWIYVPGFSYATHFHPGVDRAAPTGTPIYAKEDGVVTYAGWKNSIDGYQVEVAINAHAGYSTNHMANYAVRAGQAVTKGRTMLGRVGCTGSCTGSHTHEGVYIRDEAGRTILWDPQLFEPGGAMEDDPRVQPAVRKFHVNGPGINIRYAPPDPSDGRANVFATSRADGIYRRDGKRLSGIKYGFVFSNWKDADGIRFAVGTGYGGKRLAVAKSLIHF